MCEACAASQLPSRGYVGAVVEGRLALDRERGRITCPHGHDISVLRALPATLVR